MNLEDNIIETYLRIEEVYRSITRDCKLRQGGFTPALSDAEVLTMEILGEQQGRRGDAAIWRYFSEHWKDWFPALGSYKNFTKHCANLLWIKLKIMKILFPPSADDIHIIDGVPMPVCHHVRARRSRVFKEIAAWGFCASKDEHYYGLRGHPVINMKGQVVDFIVTPANLDERTVLSDLTGVIEGLLLGDKGFISKKRQEELCQHGINLQTPLRDNMIDYRPRKFVKTLLRVRRRIETVIGLLSEQFGIVRIKARNLWHFSNQLIRKILAFNLSLRA
jgi:hypothetical protein